MLRALPYEMHVNFEDALFLFMALHMSMRRKTPDNHLIIFFLNCCAKMRKNNYTVQ